MSAVERHAKKRGVDVVVDPRVGRALGGYKAPTKKSPKQTVVLAPEVQEGPWGPGVLGHELGHAEFDNTALGKIIQNPLARGASLAGLSIGIIIATTADYNRTTRALLGSGAAVAGHLPKLVGEAVASVKGHKVLKEQGATPEQLREARKIMALGGGTYLLGAALSAAVPAMIATR